MAGNRDTTVQNYRQEKQRERERNRMVKETGAMRRCDERADGTRARSRRERLKDEDMHINRETSTEMSDHRE